MYSKLTKRQIIRAVQELKNRATVADVVAKTGASLDAASHYLNELASETNATLSVSENGKLYYLFPPTFSYFYLTRGFRKVIKTVFEGLYAVLYFGFRISFGIALIFSVLSISFTILTFQSLLLTFMGEGPAASELWEDFIRTFAPLIRKDAMFARLALQLRGGGEVGVRLKSKLADFLAKRTNQDDKLNPVSTSTYGVSTYALESESSFNDESQPEGEGLLLDCFLFLFGEPNPNAQIDEERWRLLAQVIRLNEGVILPEHLGPYLGKDPNDEKELFKVLLKFGGKPVVSDKGVIVYIFPTMSDKSDGGDSYVMMPEKLLETPLRFLPISKERVRPVIMLACFTLVGSLFFFWLLICGSLKHSAHATFFFCLAVYSTLFLIIPAVRFAIVGKINKAIGKRNARAMSFEERLGQPDRELLEKLSEAENIRGAELQKSKDRIIYSTEKDYLEQINTEDFLRDSSRSP
ncbi:unnamed protein product [Sphagnum balticum]